jgi:hypothetical protein
MLSSTTCCFKMSSLQFHFQFGKQSEITVRQIGRMGNDNHVAVSHKLYGFQGCVGGCVVAMESVMVSPKFLSFSSHIFSQGSQNVTVKDRFDRSVRRNKFTVNNPLHVKKTSMLLSELRTSRTFLTWIRYRIPCMLKNSKVIK